MHHDHNPVMQRIDEMRAAWKENVKQSSTLVRWLLQAGDARMYEGFCRLEASPHGSIDELFVFFYTPFESPATFSKNIICDWVEELRANDDYKGRLQSAGFSINEWDYQVLENTPLQLAGSFYNAQLIRLMEAFRALLPNTHMPLVLSLLPRTVRSPGEYAQWLYQLMQMPLRSHLRILLFDHRESNYLGNVFDRHQQTSITLRHDLRMDEAVREIATSGDARRPDVQFRKCMYEMGDAAAKKQLPDLHIWGRKAVETALKSGQKDLLATAYITYAGMLFTFKEYEAVHCLLDRGIRVCKTEITVGNVALKSLLLQYYGYKAACFQQQKQTLEAFDWFMKQGKEAFGSGLFSQSVSGYHKAFLLAQSKGLRPQQTSALDAALSSTPHLKKEEIQNTEYPFVAYAYVMLTSIRTPGTDDIKAAMASGKMEELYGEDWQLTVKNLKQNFSKKQMQSMELTPVG